MNLQRTTVFYQWILSKELDLIALRILLLLKVTKHHLVILSP